MRRVRNGMGSGAALLALLVIGCGRESSAPPGVTDAENTAKATPDAVAGETALDAVNGSAYSQHVAAPELPGDVPLYAGAQLVSSMSSPARGTIVNLSSQDAVDLVAAWYGTELSARGWRLETQSSATTSRLVAAVKDARRATVLITGGADGTQILLTVVENP